jgi:hypothetical protein
MNQAIQEVTESKPALSLDTEEGRTEQVDLLKRLEMGDYTYDFTDREVSFIETWLQTAWPTATR